MNKILNENNLSSSKENGYKLNQNLAFFKKGTPNNQ